MKRNLFHQGIAASVGICILILDSKTALNGAKEGLNLCLQSLIPSLFPFFMLSSMLTSALSGAPMGILQPIGRLLKIPSGCESLLIPAFLGGYPAGAQCIGQSLRQGLISKSAAQRMLFFCNNAGPAFVFGFLGTIFPNRHMLWMLWGIQIISALMCAWIIPGTNESGIARKTENTSITDNLTSSIRIMGMVCGWVILFRVVIAFLDRWILWFFPETTRIWIAGLLELSNGCCALAKIPDIQLRFLLCSAMLSFGGVCVTMQTASVISQLSITSYVISKILQSLLSLSFGAVLVYKAPVLLLGIIFVCYILKKTVAKKASIVYNDSRNTRRNSYAVS